MAFIAKSVVISIVTFLILAVGGYVLLVRENMIHIQYSRKDINTIKESLSSINTNQLSNKFHIEQLLDEKESMVDTLKNTQRTVKALTLAMANKFPDIDLNLFISLNDILEDLPAKQSIGITKEMGKRTAILANIDEHSYLERIKMSNDFFKATEKYMLDPGTKNAIASRFFKVSFGVGGGEEAEEAIEAPTP